MFMATHLECYFSNWSGRLLFLTTNCIWFCCATTFHLCSLENFPMSEPHMLHSIIVLTRVPLHSPTNRFWFNFSPIYHAKWFLHWVTVNSQVFPKLSWLTPNALFSSISHHIFYLVLDLFLKLLTISWHCSCS